MASVSVLNETEIKQLKAKSGDLTLIQPFIPAMESAAIGAWINVNLDEGDEARTIKRRMTQAAKTVGKSLRWKRDRGDGKIVAEVVLFKAKEQFATTDSGDTAQGKVNGTISGAPAKEPVATRA